MEEFVYGIDYGIEITAQICKIIVIEGLRLRGLGFLHDGINTMNQNYTIVGLDVHGSGGQCGVINEIWKTREYCLKHCGRVLVH